MIGEPRAHFFAGMRGRKAVLFAGEWQHESCGFEEPLKINDRIPLVLAQFLDDLDSLWPLCRVEVLVGQYPYVVKKWLVNEEVRRLFLHNPMYVRMWEVVLDKENRRECVYDVADGRNSDDENVHALSYLCLIGKCPVNIVNSRLSCLGYGNF